MATLLDNKMAAPAKPSNDFFIVFSPFLLFPEFCVLFPPMWASLPTSHQMKNTFNFLSQGFLE